jgi:flagellar assembly protein FliH
MTPPTRFLFNRCFDDADDAEVIAAPVPAEPVLNRADLQRAREEGLAIGRAEAADERQARDAIESRRQETLDAIARKLDELLSKTAEASAAAGRDAILIASAVARKVLPRLYREHARSELEDMLILTLSQLPDNAEAIIRIAAPLIADLAPGIEAAAATMRPAKRVQIVGDPKVAEGDCYIEWPGGGIVRDRETLWREIDSLIEEAAGSPAVAADTLVSAVVHTGERHG